MANRVLVSVGTHEQPFQRLLNGVLETIPLFPEVEFVVQFGVGQWPEISQVEAVPYFDHQEMRRQLLAADILVTQASPGNIFGALEAGTWPLVLGRSHGLNEHVDDHQVHFASAVQDLGLGVNVKDIGLLASRLADELMATPEQRSARCECAKAESSERSVAFHHDFWKNVNVLMETSDA